MDALRPSGPAGSALPGRTRRPSRSALPDRARRARLTRPTRPQLLAATAAAVVGVLAFFPHLTTPSVVNDELVYRQAGVEYVRGIWTRNDEHPPLAKELIGLSHYVFGGFGSPVLADRLIGAILGFLTGAVLLATALVITRRWAPAVTAGLLWWALPLAPGIVRDHVARIATLEGPLLFFLSSALLAWAVAADTRRRRWLVAAAFVSGLAGACKLTGLGALAGIVPLLVLHRRQLPRAVTDAALGVVAAAVGFLLPYLPMGSQAPGVLRTAFAFQFAHADRGHLQEVAGHIYAHPPWWAEFWFQAQYLTWPAVIALYLLAVIGLVRWRCSPASWSVAAVLVVGLLANTVSPLKLPQYHDILVPELVVLAGCTMAIVARRRSTPRARTASAVVLVCLLVLAVRGVGHVAAVVSEQPEDYAAATDYLRQHLRPGERITVWGDTPAVREALPGASISSKLPAGGTPDVLITDPTITNRRPDEDVQEWVSQHGRDYRELRFERLHVFVLAPVAVGE